MNNNRKTWRKSDEQVLTRIINEFLQRGEDIEKAYEESSAALGRTTRACRERWNDIYKNKRHHIKPMVKSHEYSTLFRNFEAAYTEMEQTITDLITENEQLKARVNHLESVETKFQEVSKYFKSAV